jgi:hypothetical protein
VTDWRESSVVVRTARWLARDSIVAATGRRVWRTIKGFDAAIARAAADKDGSDDDERLRAVLRGSRVFNAFDRLFAAPSVAWESSRSREVFESTKAGFTSLPLWQRVRLIGWMVLVALATRIVLYLVSRAPVTGVTLILWGLVGAVSAVMMLVPRPVAAAWLDWRERRLRRN